MESIYRFIPIEILIVIALTRSITLDEELPIEDQLDNYDRFDPTELEPLRAVGPDELTTLSVPELYIVGALAGVSLPFIPFGLESPITILRPILLVRARRLEEAHALLVGLSRTILRIIASIVGVHSLVVMAAASNADLIRYITDTEAAAQALTALGTARLQRYNQLTAPNNIALFRELYNRSPELIGETLHPLEPIILRFRELEAAGAPLNEIVARIGMVVPPQVTNIAEYIESNIVSYREVVGDRPTTLPPLPSESNRLMQWLIRLTDQEIISYTGAYVRYESRIELVVDNALLAMDPNFFVATRRDRAVNTETIYCTPIEEVALPIAYGTLQQYRIYEIEELTAAFRSRNRWARPEAPSLEFPEDSIVDLERLLECYPGQTTSLRQVISEIYRSRCVESERAMELRAEFTVLTEGDKGLVQQLLTQMFQAGMYMRRWSGVGPYPHKSRDTNGDIDPQILSGTALGVIAELLTTMSPVLCSWCRRLPLYSCYNGRIESESSVFGELFDEVGSADFCIRQASSIFIGTAHQYLLLCFGTTMPGFSPQLLDPIQ